MLLESASAIVDGIWTDLANRVRGTPERFSVAFRADVPDILRDTAATGWCGVLEAETVLMAAGIGVAPGTRSALLDLLGAQPRCVFRRPYARATRAGGFDRVAAVDLAHALMQVERLGFDADPTPLCDALMPALTVKAFLTATELRVYWHARERHRLEPLTIGMGLAEGQPAETLRTASGYRAELFRNREGQAHAMRVTAPKWRRMRSALAYAA